MRHAKKALLLMSLLSLSLFLRANHGKDGKSEPALQGYVVDAFTKKPVKGVTIFIKSPKGDKEIYSDASGNFRIPSLPCGEVTIILEKKGYKTYRRSGVILKDGENTKMNFDIWMDETDESDIFHPLLRMVDGD